MTNTSDDLHVELDRARAAIDSFTSDLDRARNAIISQRLVIAELRELIEGLGCTVDVICSLENKLGLPPTISTQIKERTDKIRQRAREIV